MPAQVDYWDTKPFGSAQAGGFKRARWLRTKPDGNNSVILITVLY